MQVDEQREFDISFNNLRGLALGFLREINEELGERNCDVVCEMLEAANPNEAGLILLNHSFKGKNGDPIKEVLTFGLRLDMTFDEFMARTKSEEGEALIEPGVTFRKLRKADEIGILSDKQRVTPADKFEMFPDDRVSVIRALKSADNLSKIELPETPPLQDEALRSRIWSADTLVAFREYLRQNVRTLLSIIRNPDPISTND